MEIKSIKELKREIYTSGYFYLSCLLFISSVISVWVCYIVINQYRVKNKFLDDFDMWGLVLGTIITCFAIFFFDNQLQKTISIHLQSYLNRVLDDMYDNFGLNINDFTVINDFNRNRAYIAEDSQGNKVIIDQNCTDFIIAAKNRVQIQPINKGLYLAHAAFINDYGVYNYNWNDLSGDESDTTKLATGIVLGYVIGNSTGND